MGVKTSKKCGCCSKVKPKIKKKKTSKGFTLIEMLVVIVIIGILAAIVIYSVAGARQKANAARAKADMGQMKDSIEKANSIEGCTNFTFTNSGNGTVLSCGGVNYATIQLPTIGGYSLTVGTCINTGTTSSWTASGTCPNTSTTINYTLQVSGLKNSATYTCTNSGCVCSSGTAGDCDSF